MGQRQDEIPAEAEAGRSPGVSQTFLVLICTVAALGGLLFGFDTAVVSGAVGLFRAEFHLDALMTGWAAGSAIVGCMVGAAVAGPLTDAFGRRRILLLAGAFFAASAIGCGLARGVDHLVWARIVGGIGIGIASIVSPMYIAEVAPAAVRGRLVTFQQLAIVSGILVAFFTNRMIVVMAMTDPQKWRWMFTLGAFPAVLFIGLLLFIPESPRWLAKQGGTEAALRTLTRISGPQEADAEMSRIVQAVGSEGGSFAELLRPGLRRALFIATALAIFSQITGINAIMYYAPEVFKQAGAGNAAAFNSAIWVGVVNFLATIVAMNTVDRLGRRPLLLWGATFLALALFAVGFAFQTHAGGVLVLVAVLGYVAGFAVSFGPVCWVIIAEFFPTQTRGRAMSVATVALWGACYLVSQTFPVLLERLGSAWTFWGYGVIAAVAAVFIAAFVPETKGRSLEEIQQSWRRIGNESF
jgi:SP family arabinose:H+ symporter-like MFS transporter